MRKSIQRQGPMLAALMAVLTLTGCAQFEIADRSVDYNLAVETASNRQLLLNAVRASKRYPRVYTNLTKISSASPISTQFAFGIPFGGDATSTFTFNPTLTTQSGIQFDLSVLDTQDFMKGILKPVDAATIDYYLKQGWPKEMLFHMLIREIKFDEQQAIDNINEKAKAECGPNNKGHKLCKFRALKMIGEHDCKDDLAKLRTGNKSFLNAPGHRKKEPCVFLRFQNLIRKLLILVLKVDEVVKEKIVSKTTTTFDPKTKKYKVEITEEPIIEQKLPLSYDLKKGANPTKELTCTDRRCLRVEGTEVAESVGSVFLRSPESMIFYLGELIEAQNQATPPYTPMVIGGPDTDPKKVPLFRVLKGTPGENTAVSVSHEGETYYIPRGKEKAGRSMSVLTLVKQLFAQQKSAKELQSTPTVRLIGQ